MAPIESIAFLKLQAFLSDNHRRNPIFADMAGPNLKTQAERIKYVRSINKLTQAAFARALGTTRGAVGNWEPGNGIKTENLALIARRFSIPMDWRLPFGPRIAPTLSLGSKIRHF